MKSCPRSQCGAATTPEANFCPNCGMPLNTTGDIHWAIVYARGGSYIEAIWLMTSPEAAMTALNRQPGIDTTIIFILVLLKGRRNEELAVIKWRPIEFNDGASRFKAGEHDPTHTPTIQIPALTANAAG